MIWQIVIYAECCNIYSKREEYDKLLIKLIEMNFVNSYEDVKSAIDKLIIT